MNDRGFLLVSMSVFLPLLLAGAVLFAATSRLTESIEADRKQCRRTLAEGLERAGRQMKALVDLNPEALRLRFEERAARTGLALALARFDPISTSAHRAWLARIHVQQKVLHQRQKLHLEIANRLIAQTQLAAQSGLRVSGDTFQRRTPKPFIRASAALRPDHPGVAPLWHPVPNFERAQILKQEWTQKYELKGPGARFMSAKGHREDSCAITLTPSGSFWRARIAEDRSWLKP